MHLNNSEKKRRQYKVSANKIANKSEADLIHALLEQLNQHLRL